MHYGEITFGVDERGEVVLLTRNIKIQASEDAEKSYFGGHIMAMAGSKMYIDSIELNRMGQHMHLARYPIHWHLIGEAPASTSGMQPSHDTYNRCVTVHGTNDLRIENNVDLQHRGSLFLHGRRHRARQRIHQEPGNPDQVSSDIGLRAHQSRRQRREDSKYGDRAAFSKASFHSGNTLLPSDNTVSAFWITNPDNSYIGQCGGRFR